MRRQHSTRRSEAWTRRSFMQLVGAGAFGACASPWLAAMADELADHPKRRRHCVLLWMAGGPSQTDTFDMKPNHANGGEFKEIQTSAPGLRFSEHLPELAKMADKLAIVRGLSTKEGDHGRGAYLMRTGQTPGGPLRYPAIGAALAKELGDIDAALPSYVSIAPYTAFNPEAYSPGFLGPSYAAATVAAKGVYNPEQNPTENNDAVAGGFANLGVDNLSAAAGVTPAQLQQRREMWRRLQKRFLTGRGAAEAAHAQDTVFRRAMRMMNADSLAAFDLSSEPDEVRQAYGPEQFGQGCLMARRLIERGVAFVEVSLGQFEGGAIGWDTHQNNFPAVRSLSAVLDRGWSTLMRELDERGLLEQTTIIWMGEFGRTPTINTNAGRDHFPAAWTCVLGGGGIAGGQAHGATSDDGSEVAEGRVSESDVLATLCRALGVDPQTENMTSVGRPVKITEGAPISQILA